MLLASFAVLGWMGRVGFWYARSSEFIHQPLIHNLVWMQVPGDVIFGAGCLAIGAFVMGLWQAAYRSVPQPGLAS